MDKSDFMRFVNSGRWNCTSLMKTTRLNEGKGVGKKGCWDGVSSLPEKNRSAICPDSKIRRGPGFRTQTVPYKLLASWSCPELNLIKIQIHSHRMRS